MLTLRQPVVSKYRSTIKRGSPKSNIIAWSAAANERCYLRRRSSIHVSSNSGFYRGLIILCYVHLRLNCFPLWFVFKMNPLKIKAYTKNKNIHCHTEYSSTKFLQGTTHLMHYEVLIKRAKHNSFGKICREAPCYISTQITTRETAHSILLSAKCNK